MASTQYGSTPRRICATRFCAARFCAARFWASPATMQYIVVHGCAASSAATDHRWMTDADLITRAQAAGVSASYLDWRKRRVQVPAETLTAILQALGKPPAACTHGVADTQASRAS